MSFKSILLVAITAVSFALPSLAHDTGTIVVEDAYARAAGVNAKAGAAFMEISNHTPEDDRLLSATSDVAARVELHTHKDMGGGVMQMSHVEEGFVIPAGETHMLERGGDHVMFMGLNRSLNDGDVVTVTLTFEKAGEMVVEIPVDLNR